MATSSAFPVSTANLDLRGEQFQANKKNWIPVIEKFEKALKEVSAEGNDVSLKRHQSRGQLLRNNSPVLDAGSQALTFILQLEIGSRCF